METHLRVARPTNNLKEAVKFFKEGLGFEIIASFENHEGFNGVMFGHKKISYHFEVTEQIGHSVEINPTQEDLLVFYINDKSDWEYYKNKLAELGFKKVNSSNPYWNLNGVTYEDYDGYRVVLQNSEWKILKD